MSGAAGASATQQPSGTVTFAFTDIEGSTQRWDRDRPAMEAAVRRHDAIMRAAIGEHRGHVFKTIGDAFCAAFERPEAAVAAMLAAQQRLADEDFTAVDGIRVRAAIHTGTADERDGDYFGPALNRIARLVAIGHGGQVLVSGVTSELVRDTLPPDVSLRDHGEHRLRDLTRPEHVYQLVAPGLRDDFPALRSLSELPNNLPRMLNAFVGREREIDEITALVQAHPLVTLVGAGGLGKTRTSLQVAAQLLDGSRALIDWSHDLLDERERTLFRRLGIFVNGFTLASAAAVVADEEIDEVDVFDLVESLVDKSLVATEAGEVQRYRMLESTRAYALEKIMAAGEREWLAARHLQCLRTRFAELAAGEARTGRQRELAAELEIEHEDLRAALTWAVASKEVEDGAALLVDIRRAWLDIGSEAECVAWCDAYLAALGPNAGVLRAMLLVIRTQALDSQGLIERTRESAAHALEQARATGDPTALVRALNYVAWVHLRDSRFEDAEIALGEAEAIPAKTMVDRLNLMEAHALLHLFRADYDAAVRTLAALRSEQRALGNVHGELRAAMNLAGTEHARGETRRSIAIAREILPAMRLNGDTSSLAIVLCNLASGLVEVNDLLAAAEAAREAMSLLVADKPDHYCVTISVEVFALISALIGDLERAARLLGYSDTAFKRIGFAREAGEQRTYDRLRTLLHAGLQPGEIERCTALGSVLEPADAFALALEAGALHPAEEAV